MCFFTSFVHFHHWQSPLRSQEKIGWHLGAKIKLTFLSCASSSFTCRGLKLGALDPEILVRSGLGDVSAPAWLRHRPLSKTLIVKARLAGLRREALQALSGSLSHACAGCPGTPSPPPPGRIPVNSPAHCGLSRGACVLEASCHLSVP